MRHSTLHKNRPYIFLLGALLCFLNNEASAQFFQLRLVSSAYAWQRFDSVNQSTNHLFGYQTAQLSVAGENISFHTYLQGFNDFSGPVKKSGNASIL